MPTLLKLDVSPRGDHSVSRALGAQFVEQWKQAHPGGEVVTRDLATTKMPFTDLPWILSAYTPPDARSPEQSEALTLSDTLVQEIETADQILLTTPMYNFGVPAALKAWIDHIVRAGKTFQANPDGSYTGLIKSKPVAVVIASAGSYAAGTPGETFNAERPYLKLIFGFLGLPDVTFIEAGGTYQVDRGMKSRDELMVPLAEQVKAAASR